MGASCTKIEEDGKLVKLCRERKKFLRQALDGRCALAAIHVAYIEALRNTGIVLSKFVEPESHDVSINSKPENTDKTNTNTVSSSPSPPKSIFRRMFTSKSKEKPSPVISNTTEKPIPEPTEKVELSPIESPPGSPIPPPWDYFELSNDQFLGNKETNNREKEEEIEIEEEEITDDEFEEEPSAETLVRSFENLHRTRGPVISEIESPELSPLGPISRGAKASNDIKMKPIEEDYDETMNALKDLFSNMKKIEVLFHKASDSGQEVPRMLEANKLHFRPILPGNRSKASTLLRSFLPCTFNPRLGQEESSQASGKYLTWSRNISSQSSSSRNFLNANSVDSLDNSTTDTYDYVCMTAGSHVSTLDRLFAWEKKLYDEVKSSNSIRKDYDRKCKVLAHLEAKDASRVKIDKTRVRIKDLHSRIKVSLYRIETLSKKIQELRDKELQPQLEELIEGLRKMWEEMLEFHSNQFNIISNINTPGTNKIFIQSDSRKQISNILQNELSILSLTFTKWISIQKLYVEAINNWLIKCVNVAEKSSRRKRKSRPPRLSKMGPPVFAICGVWLEKIETLPTKEVADSIQALVSSISRQEKRQQKGSSIDGDDPRVNLLKDEAVDDNLMGFNYFCKSLGMFLWQLNKFADSSVEMYTEIKKEIQDAKKFFEQSF